jgi:hypothetical protein
MKKKEGEDSFFSGECAYFLPRVSAPIKNKMTATTSKIMAKSLDKPATPPKPNRLASNAITAKIMAQRNMSILLIVVVLLLVLSIDRVYFSNV